MMENLKRLQEKNKRGWSYGMDRSK